jgi:hypothetical protein
VRNADVPGGLPADPPRRRLTGWKEIAAYLDKGMRTAQRWEGEFGLPVRRIGDNEGVFAFADEIDAWQEERARLSGGLPPPAVGGTGDDDGTASAGTPSRAGSKSRSGWTSCEGAAQEEGTARVGAESAGAPVTGVLRRSWVQLSAALAIVVLVSMGIASRWAGSGDQSPAPQPASADVRDDTLLIRDADREVIREVRFPFRLHENVYQPSPIRDRTLIQVADVDGDGRREVLLVARTSSAEDGTLYCFEADGTLRFTHRAEGSIQFGPDKYAGPFPATGVFVTGSSSGRISIWVLGTHTMMFPSVLHRLDARGDVTDTYWSNGHIEFVAEGDLNGRPVVFVAGINNDRKGGSLAVLDAGSATGAAPAENPYYRCEDCPHGTPLAFMVFPTLGLRRGLNSMSSVRNIYGIGSAEMIMRVEQGEIGGGPEGDPTPAAAYYFLDQSLNVVRAEVGSEYVPLRDRLIRTGILPPNVADEDPDAALFPVLYWDGHGFSPR